MSGASRLRLDASTQLPSIQSFGELGDFLRASIADEESRELSDSLSQLALHCEAAIASLRLGRQRTVAAPAMMDLMTVLRRHRALVAELGLHWQGLYEYGAYLQALNHFRSLIGQWLLAGNARSAELPMKAEDLELVVWRTLGEGMLLIDMYEQVVPSEAHGHVDGGQHEESSTQPAAQGVRANQLERAVHWWKRLGI